MNMLHINEWNQLNMLYLASGVLCVDSSENQLEEFGDSSKDCDFMRKYNEFITVC